jgi:Rieske Fe-S protein
MPHPETDSPNRPCGAPPSDRRRREVLITMALAGAAALMTGIPLGLYAVAPTLGQGIDKWIDLGPVGDLPQDGFEMRSYEFLIKDGWLVLPQRGFVWARRGPDGKAQVFSSTCTHLACNVIWQDATGTFECPCHSGKFDAEGRPIAGPPTRPLKALEYTLEADLLKVHMTV